MFNQEILNIFNIPQFQAKEMNKIYKRMNGYAVHFHVCIGDFLQMQSVFFLV